ncbi:hypothetical protein AB6D11_27985, partial [Vibrio splendidus]
LGTSNINNIAPWVHGAHTLNLLKMITRLRVATKILSVKIFIWSLSFVKILLTDKHTTFSWNMRESVTQAT